jgi:hypothetical protein
MCTGSSLVKPTGQALTVASSLAFNLSGQDKRGTLASITRLALVELVWSPSNGPCGLVPE